MVSDAEWGPHIRAQRKTLGITQAVLARAVGISVATMCRWELEHGNPSPAMRERIEEALTSLAGQQKGNDDVIPTGARIRSARLERGWTQAQLAQRIVEA